MSAYFGNGSFLDIAKIEGGAAYKEYMLDPRPAPHTRSIPVYCPLPGAYCAYWPLQRIQTTNPLAPLHKALLAAAEATLETDIRSTVIAAHGMQSPDDANDLARAAFADMGLELRRHIAFPMKHFVPLLQLEGICNDQCCAYRPGGPEIYVEDPLILGIEYTRGNMAASFGFEQCGMYVYTSRASSSETGHDAMQTYMNTAANVTSFAIRFENVLQGLIAESRSGKESALDAVVLFGEQANDEQFGIWLRKSLRNLFANGKSVQLYRGEHVSPDPAYLASRVMAMAVFESKEYRESKEGRGHTSSHEL